MTTPIKPKRYFYELPTIKSLLSIKLQTSTSFRAISQITGILNNSLTPEKQPTYQTILSWVKKIGYYNLSRAKIKADDWIIILDESIQLGQDKLLVIFGVRESELMFKKALNFNDLTPLKEIVKTSWTGEIIEKELLNLKEELGSIIYAVGDHGGDIKKGLRLAKIPHIHDITHRIALTLGKIYKNDDYYIELTKQMGKMRTHNLQTKIAHIIPPKQRIKSRYQNIKTISDWGIKALKLLNNPETDEEIMEKLSWLKKYQLFINELAQINNTICEIEKLTKTYGLTKATASKAMYIIKNISIRSIKSQIIEDDLEKYFHLSLSLLSGRENILCTSDIIESAFGKYKNYLNNNPMAGITDLALCISAFTSNLSDLEIKKALESTTMKNIEKWRQENIGMTLLQKRRKALVST